MKEGEIEELQWKIVPQQGTMTKGHAIKQPRPTSQAPFLLKQKLSMKDFKHDENDIDGEPANKKNMLRFGEQSSTTQKFNSIWPQMDEQ